MKSNPLTQFLFRWLPHKHESRMCQCRQCGQPNTGIDLEHELIGCHCVRCGATVHNFDGCQCIRCGIIRDKDHTWDGCVCSRCNQKRDESHTWDHCICRQCHTTRNREHSWTCGVCSYCGRRSAEGHTWDGCKCLKCGTTRDSDHQWNGASGEQCACSRCGSKHSWIEISREEWKETRGFYNDKGSGASYEPAAIYEEVDMARITSRCVLCGEEITREIMLYKPEYVYSDTDIT